MEMTELVEKVKQWSIDRELNEGDSNRQFLKLIEEVGEVAEALAKNKHDDFVDGIGDTLVVLIILCQQQGLDVGECLEVAYKEIAERKGETVNGVFIKEG